MEQVVVVSAPKIVNLYKKKAAVKSESIAVPMKSVPFIAPAVRKEKLIFSKTLWEKLSRMEKKISHDLISEKKGGLPEFIKQMNQRHQVNAKAPHATIHERIISKSKPTPILSHDVIDRLIDLKDIYKYENGYDAAFQNLVNRFTLQYIKKMDIDINIDIENPKVITKKQFKISGKNITYRTTKDDKPVIFGKSGGLDIMGLKGVSVAVGSGTNRFTGKINDRRRILDDEETDPKRKFKSLTDFAKKAGKTDPEGDIIIQDGKYAGKPIRYVRRLYEIDIYNLLRNRILKMYDGYMNQVYRKLNNIGGETILSEIPEDVEMVDIMFPDISIVESQAIFTLPGSKRERVTLDLDQCLMPLGWLQEPEELSDDIITESDLIDLGLLTFKTFENKIKLDDPKSIAADLQRKEMALIWSDTHEPIALQAFKKAEETMAKKAARKSKREQEAQLSTQRTEKEKPPKKKKAKETSEEETEKVAEETTEEERTKEKAGVAEKPKKGRKKKPVEKDPQIVGMQKEIKKLTTRLNKAQTRANRSLVTRISEELQERKRQLADYEAKKARETPPKEIEIAVLRPPVLPPMSPQSEQRLVIQKPSSFIKVPRYPPLWYRPEEYDELVEKASQMGQEAESLTLQAETEKVVAKRRNLMKKAKELNETALENLKKAEKYKHDIENYPQPETEEIEMGTKPSPEPSTTEPKTTETSPEEEIESDLLLFGQ